MAETYRLVFLMPHTRLRGLPPIRMTAERNLQFEEAQSRPDQITAILEKHPLERPIAGIEIEPESTAQ